MATIAQVHGHRASGQTSVSTTAIPVTRVAAASSSNTTYTSTTAVDPSAWDLSGVIAGDVAVTSEGYQGIITAVDDGNDTITIGDGWQAPSGVARISNNANIKPTDSSTTTIHRVTRANRFKLMLPSDATDVVYVGRHGSASATDYPLTAGSGLPLRAGDDQKYLDISNLYVIAASGTQEINWIAGGE